MSTRKQSGDRPIPHRYTSPRPGVLEPATPTAIDRYQALKRVFTAAIQRVGFPRPDDYRTWYEQEGVAALVHAAFPEIRHCRRCGKELENDTGFVLVEAPSGPRVKEYCSERCRSQARTAKSRAAHPEAKLRRR